VEPVLVLVLVLGEPEAQRELGELPVEPVLVLVLGESEAQRAAQRAAQRELGKFLMLVFVR